jgi:D-alanyl-D-alanine carboxypeptidase
MIRAAEDDGVLLLVQSSYRSVRYQKKIFQRLFAKGRTYEDVVRYVAPPGYSEHSLGTVVDFYPSNWKFASTAQYQWLRNNGEKYHFSESYPENNKEMMPWEAWHWRWRRPADTQEIVQQ